MAPADQGLSAADPGLADVMFPHELEQAIGRLYGEKKFSSSRPGSAAALCAQQNLQTRPLPAQSAVIISAGLGAVEKAVVLPQVSPRHGDDDLAFRLPIALKDIIGHS